MQITITVTKLDSDEPELLPLEAYPEMTIESLQSFIQAETSVLPASQLIYYNGALVIDGSKTLRDLNITDGDMVVVRVRQPRTDRVAPVPTEAQSRRDVIMQQDDSSGDGRQPDPELIRLQILGNPSLRAVLAQHQPSLSAALDDPALFNQMFSESFNRERRSRGERQRQVARLNDDPFDVEAQTRIQEMIRQERVMENIQSALDHNPEVFGRVHLLYVDVEVNGHKLKAMVDTGAQATIMSPSCAEKCSITWLVDKRFSGVARGVGTANILGRVHAAEIKIGGLHLACSFTVMEGKNVELLVGLDMLKRHQVYIDLARDLMVIQGVEIPFLSEADSPKTIEEAMASEPTIPGPSGTLIGQRSGVVLGPTGTDVAPESEAGAAAGNASQDQIPPRAALSDQQQQQASDESGSFLESDVQQLMALGASRDIAIGFLRATGGNVEQAANLLFQG